MPRISQSELDALNARSKNLEATIQVAAEKARKDARRDAFQLVIDALELDGYKRANIPLLHLISDPNAPAATERLEADLRTALRVRAEKKAAADDAATERRIGALTKPGNSFARGSSAPFFNPLAPTVADCFGGYTPVKTAADCKDVCCGRCGVTEEAEPAPEKPAKAPKGKKAAK